MLVKVCAVSGGHGRDGTMMVVGSLWKREGVEERKEKEGRTVYRWEDRVESCGLLTNSSLHALKGDTSNTLCVRSS